MTLKLNYSRLLHVFILMSFFLPFYQVGCNKEEPATAKEFTNVADSSEMNSIIILDSLESKDSTNDSIHSFDNTNKYDESLSEELASKHNLYKILLTNNDRFTGIGAIVDTLEYLILFAITISFLLIILSLIAKITERNILYVTILTECIAFIFLYISCKSIFEKKLYGYWISITLLLLTIIYDSILFWQQRKNKENTA